MKVDGACSCGAIRIEAEADPEKVQICHCTDCQTATGTAFRVSIPVPGASLKVTGEPAIYVKTTAESGKPRAQAFCGKCGSPIYSTTLGGGVQPSYTLRVGILRQRDQLAPRRQIWWRSARPWVTELAAMPKHEKQG
ncbi:MAG TPA: GFA family protein [Xanthobacteraceae bacterium]|nr:GFA family protein [Xanthobacteraceae bacterium]